MNVLICCRQGKEWMYRSPELTVLETRSLLKLLSFTITSPSIIIFSITFLPYNMGFVYKLISILTHSIDICFYTFMCIYAVMSYVILQQVSCTMINKEYLILSYLILYNCQSKLWLATTASDGGRCDGDISRGRYVNLNYILRPILVAHVRWKAR